VNDDRISRYLNQQADGIALAPADPADVMRRGGRRRARRRAGLVGAVAALGLVATSVAVHDSGSDQKVTSVLGSATASTFDWSTVTPQSGLGYGNHTAQLADGSVYSLSTAPGTVSTDAPSASTLYQSTDGAEWSARSLPTGARTSDLAGAGNVLYAVGTSPAGGVVVSSSHDAAGSWSSVSLPDEAAQLQARHPGRIVLGPARVAARDGSHVVASIVATTNLDPGTFGHPEYAGEGYAWSFDADGATVYENPKSECANIADASGAPITKDEGVACREAVKQSTPGPKVASFSWGDLGITGELRDHVGGQPYVYVSDDGQTFAKAELPSELSVGVAGGWVSSPIATDDGFRLVLAGDSGYPGLTGTSHPTTTVLRSADGHSWTGDTSFPGSPGDVGVLGGRAAVSVWGDDGASTVQLEQADGTWSVLDLSSAVTAPTGGWSSPETISFGPLGLAAVVGTGGDTSPYVQHIVHSTDGSSLQVMDVADVIHNGGMVSGVTVTADAIVARVITPSDGDDSTPPTQEVLVGTPR
jgi:hypothetical protein